jgi:hypothetical protein
MRIPLSFSSPSPFGHAWQIIAPVWCPVCRFARLTHRELHGLIVLLSTIYNPLWENIELIVKYPRPAIQQKPKAAMALVPFGPAR